LLYAYHRSNQVFWCPSSFISYNSVSGQPVPGNGQYGASSLVMGTTTRGGINMAAIASSATTYFVMDWGVYEASTTRAVTSSGGYFLPGMGTSGGTCSANTLTDPNRAADCASGRHFEGVNVGFADGHAKWLKSTVVVSEAKKYVNATSNSDWNPLVD
jgi:prepilin-type processing-associated H-X9-DG protein